MPGIRVYVSVVVGMVSKVNGITQILWHDQAKTTYRYYLWLVYIGDRIKANSIYR